MDNFIITLTGPSGCGKSYVIDRILELESILKQKSMTFEPVRFPKYVTRPMRREEIQKDLEGEQIDIISVDYIPKDCDIKYQTYGKQYAIRQKDLRDLLDKGKWPLVVINDVRVVEELKKLFPGQVLALFLFRGIPTREAFLKEALKREGKSAANELDERIIQELEDRLDKATALYRTFIENISLFNRVILNVGNEDTDDYAQIQLENLMSSILCGKLSLSSKRDGNPKLFIITGHAKSGKDEIIKAIDDMGRLQATIVRKYTSRRQDPDDGNEMICRLIPSSALLSRFENEYANEVDRLKQEYEQKRIIYKDDIDKLTDEVERIFKDQRALIKPTNRFWNLLKSEEAKIADDLRKRIVSEAASCHRLESLNLYDMSHEQLIDLYCKDGYHRQSITASMARAECENLLEQEIIYKIMEEASVENDVSAEKVNKVETLKDVVVLYKNDGYHSDDADLSYPDREKTRVENELFEINPEYIDLFDLVSRHEKAASKKERPQKWTPEDKACYLIDGETGYILYENNKTRYGFEVYNASQKEKILLSKLKTEKKHLVLVASLPEIFRWCEKFTSNNVVTVFAHSEISADEFAKKASSDAEIRKLERYSEEILKYSHNIALFDHVTIFAEEHINEKPGAREEELFDQMFRLFRYYNSK